MGVMLMTAEAQASGSQPRAAPAPDIFDAAEFHTATGDRIEKVLDLNTWHGSDDLTALYARLDESVRRAVGREDAIRADIRKRIFPRLRDTTYADAPPSAGVTEVTVDEIAKVHRGLLFNGQVEACDGTNVMHDTLPLTIAQIGVCLVSYHGNNRSLAQRVYRRDLPFEGTNPVDEVLAVLDRRRLRTGLEMERPRDALSDLAPRGIMAYAERSALVYRSEAPWRMGHGNPTPYELLTGSGMAEILERGLDVMAKLIDHGRFVFVPSAAAERMWLTVGNALRPLEYAIFRTQRDWLERIREGWQYHGASVPFQRLLRDFVEQYGPKVVLGAYRASEAAPAQLFYAHIEHAEEAALIALADSTLQEHRGFPVLIDVAHMFCSATFDPASFNASTQLAYLDAGDPYRYLAERSTRR
jgi:hypothetical protein